MSMYHICTKINKTIDIITKTCYNTKNSNYLCDGEKEVREKIILHSDCNNFFASVEENKNPKLRNVPMAVCGSVENRHGIVLAKNSIAKKYNIVTAETVFSAKRKCPELVIIEPHYGEY